MQRHTRSWSGVTLGGALLLLTSTIASAQFEAGETALAARLERSIAFWQARVERNPDAFLELTLLGEAVGELARMDQDVDLYREAESTLRRAVRSNPSYGRARVALSFVLVQLHGFDEATAFLEPLAATGQLALQTRAYLADAYLALGRYADAREMLGVDEVPRSAALLSRRARLADLDGRADGGRARGLAPLRGSAVCASLVRSAHGRAASPSRTAARCRAALSRRHGTEG